MPCFPIPGSGHQRNRAGRAVRPVTMPKQSPYTDTVSCPAAARQHRPGVQPADRTQSIGTASQAGYGPGRTLGWQPQSSQKAPMETCPFAGSARSFAPRRGFELDVSAHDQVAVVAPGEAVASLSPVFAVLTWPVDQPGELAGPVAAHRGDRPAAPGPAPHPHHRRAATPAPGASPRRGHQESRLFLEDDVSPSAAAVIPPAATHPSSTARRPAHRARPRSGRETAWASRAGATASTPPPSSSRPGT